MGMIVAISELDVESRNLYSYKHYVLLGPY